MSRSRVSSSPPLPDPDSELVETVNFRSSSSYSDVSLISYLSIPPTSFVLLQLRVFGSFVKSLRLYHSRGEVRVLLKPYEKERRTLHTLVTSINRGWGVKTRSCDLLRLLKKGSERQRTRRWVLPRIQK